MPRVCVKCVGDLVLKAWIDDEGEDVACTFCENEDGPSVTAEQLAERIDAPIREFYQPGPRERRWSRGDAHSDWEQQGYELHELLQEICAVEYEVAEAVAEALTDSESIDDGDFARYGETKLVHIDPDPIAWRSVWEEFEERIKHRSRFFDTKAEEYLKKLIGDLAEFRDGAALLRIGPRTAHRSLYRARVAQSDEQAREFVRDPLKHLGPPPPSSATPGRMNPAGIPVFYGAFAPEVCIAEVRSPVGGVVVVGHFRIIRPLRLLDLSYFGRTLYPESIFLPEYGEIIKRLEFLRELQERLSRPVTPSDESLEYVPTQAVAEYIARRMQLDGVVYNSSQIGPPAVANGKPEAELPLFGILRTQPVTQCNVALFGRAALVGPVRSESSDAETSGATPGHALELDARDPEPHRVSRIQVSSVVDYKLYPQRDAGFDDDEDFFR
jgi:hypothetical protein